MLENKHILLFVVYIGKKKADPITHVIAVRPPHCYGQSEFGLSLQDKLTEVSILVALKDCRYLYRYISL